MVETGGRRRTTFRTGAVATAVAFLLVASVTLSGRLEGRPAVMLDDLAELAAALVAAASTGLRARSSTGRSRQSWAWLAAGCASWAIGQAVWSWYELVLRHDTPFPSFADVGYLGFTVGVCGALCRYPAGGGRGDHRRRVLDGLTVTIALVLLSWSTALGAVIAQGGQGVLTTAVSLAYPTSDLVVLTVVVLLLGRATTDRRTLGLLGSGIAAIAVADSAFLYLTASGAYTGEATSVGLGWIAGFLVLALAPLSVGATQASAIEEHADSVKASALPYLPLCLAVILLTGQTLGGHTPGPGELALVAINVGLVLVRQFATVQDNSRLAGELAVREAELRHLAFHDGLTGLANRALFADRVGHALELHQRDLRPMAVLFCDLDDFKVVNDTLGHATGDALLVRVAERLRGALRAGDTLARLGGDEFAILLENTAEPTVVAQKVVDCLRAPFFVTGRSLLVGGSVGLAAVGPDRATPPADVLLAQADLAMYAAKRSGKGSLRTYEDRTPLDGLTDAQLTAALETAISDRLIAVAYQPVVDLVSGVVVGVEALARWNHEGQPVPPAAFIPIAESTGLMGPLTDLVLDLACAQAAAWARGGAPTSLRVSVNLSPVSVSDRALPARVAACLARHDIDGSSLVLEITESGLMTSPEAARAVCAELRAQGILLALDDFGVGYSSLAHLNMLPLDLLKLDRLFLEGVGREESQTLFVGAVLRLAAELGLKVVAEGVENSEQLQHLQGLRCAYAQGYLLAPPLTAPQVTLLFEQRLVASVIATP